MKRVSFAAMPIIAVAAVGATVAVHAQQIEVNRNNRTIAVTATEKATAAAEVATVHVGFQVFAADSQSAYALGSRTSTAIAAALKQAGVEENAIQSDAQSVGPVEPYQLQNLPDAQKAQRQFQLAQSWSIKTSAAAAGTVLDAAVQGGANESGQIEWDVADPDALEAAAAESALKRAHAIADQMAKGLSVNLGALVYASNQAAERPMPLALPKAGAMITKNDRPVLPLSLRPQKVTRSATVYAVFAIE